jgi:sporulation protein YlmC with PRC-barrel domain
MTGSRKMALVALAIFLGAFFGVAQRQTALAEDSRLPFDPQRLGLMRDSASLIGTRVIDVDLRYLGKIQVFLCDLSKGQIAAALVRSRGKEPFTPVPPTWFASVRLDYVWFRGTREQFTAAPHFLFAGGEGGWNRGTLDETFQYFSIKVPETAAGQTGYVTADSLLRQRLASQDNQPLGQVKNVFLDLPSGQIYYLEIEPASELDLPSPGLHYLVPPQSVQLGADGSGLVLKAGMKHFLAGYHFPKEFPSDIVFPEVAMSVYRHYGLLQGTASSGGPGLSAVLGQAINR